jgi:hypothetical protein
VSLIDDLAALLRNAQDHERLFAAMTRLETRMGAIEDALAAVNTQLSDAAAAAKTRDTAEQAALTALNDHVATLESELAGTTISAAAQASIDGIKASIGVIGGLDPAAAAVPPPVTPPATP